MTTIAKIPAILSAVTPQEAQKLAELATDKDMLEMGAQYGFSTIVLAQVTRTLCSVDWHQGDEFAKSDSWSTYLSNLHHYGVIEKVDIRRGRFEQVLPDLAQHGVTFDGCFLDGNHTAKSVQADLDLMLPLLRQGGFVAFHDYGRNWTNGYPWFGVTEVADRFGIEGVVGHLAWGSKG